MKNEVFTQVGALWDFLRLKQGQKGKLIIESYHDNDCGSQVHRPFEGLLVFGCHDLRVASQGAWLYRKRLAPKIIVTGGYGRITRELWKQPEAEKFAEVMITEGVPRKHIAIEPKAANTGENIQFGRQIAEEQQYFEDLRQTVGIDKAVIGKQMSQWIAVTAPYKERRTLAALEKQWPECRFFMASPQYGFQEYWDIYASGKEVISLDEWVSLLVGEVQRLIIYGGDMIDGSSIAKNSSAYQSYQAIPPCVLDAYKELADMGYKKHLVI